MKLSPVLACTLCGANLASDLDGVVCVMTPPDRDAGRPLVLHDRCATAYRSRASYSATIEHFGRDLLRGRGLAEAVLRGDLSEWQANDFLSSVYLDPRDEWLRPTEELKHEIAEQAVAEHNDVLDSIEGEKLPRRDGQVPEGAADLRRS